MAKIADAMSETPGVVEQVFAIWNDILGKKARILQGNFTPFMSERGHCYALLPLSTFFLLPLTGN